MKIQQAVNRIIEAIAAQVETLGPDHNAVDASLVIALQNYRQALSTGLETGQFLLVNWDIEDHGLESSQYFQGAGVAFTSYDHIVTGCGDNPREALEDCLESIAMQSIELGDCRLEAIAKDYPLVPSASDEVETEYRASGYDEDEVQEIQENSELHYYVSIRFNRRFCHTNTATTYAESIVNGNCKYVIEQLLEMPANRALAVTAYILEYLPSADASYRNRFMAMLGNMTD